MFTQILLEVYCTKKHNINLSAKKPFFCESEECIPSYNCLLNKCPFVEFTSHENALCYIDNNSEATEIISLGGEMLKNNIDEATAKALWKEIAVKKINEAYEEYLTAMEL